MSVIQAESLHILGPDFNWILDMRTEKLSQVELHLAEYLLPGDNTAVVTSQLSTLGDGMNSTAICESSSKTQKQVMERHAIYRKHGSSWIHLVTNDQFFKVVLFRYSTNSSNQFNSCKCTFSAFLKTEVIYDFAQVLTFRMSTASS